MENRSTSLRRRTKIGLVCVCIQEFHYQRRNTYMLPRASSVRYKGISFPHDKAVKHLFYDVRLKRFDVAALLSILFLQLNENGKVCPTIISH